MPPVMFNNVKDVYGAAVIGKVECVVPWKPAASSDTVGLQDKTHSWKMDTAKGNETAMYSSLVVSKSNANIKQQGNM